MNKFMSMRAPPQDWDSSDAEAERDILEPEKGAEETEIVSADAEEDDTDELRALERAAKALQQNELSLGMVDEED